MATLLVAGIAAVAPPPLAACTGKDCVFFFRGTLTQSTGVSPDGTWVKEVELADVDADGRLDLLMVQKQPLVEEMQGSETVLVIRPQDQRDVLYLGVGPAGFNFELDSLATAFVHKTNAFLDNFQTNRGYDAELADFNGNGHLDIMRPDTPGLLALLLGNGDGTFDHHDAFLLMPQGDPNDNCVLSFIGDDGNPSTSCPNDVNCGGNYDDVDVADVDHDGDPDFLIANWLGAACGTPAQRGTNVLVENLGAAVFGDPPALSALDIPAFEADVTHTVALGDANGDCLTDVLLGHAQRPDIFFGQLDDGFSFPGQPSFTFTGPSQTDNNMTVADIVGDPGLSAANQAACDFDGDGTPDDDGIPDDLPDLTGDGHSEVFLAQDGLNGSGEFGVYINSGQPPPFSTFTTCSGTCSDDNRYDTRYGDFDGDGQMEAAVVGFNVTECQMSTQTGSCEQGATCAIGSSLTVFRFTGTGFTDVTDEFADSAAMASTNQGGISIASGDLDSDGDDDIVLGGTDVDGQIRDEFFPCSLAVDVDVFGAAHVFENLTRTRLADRTLSSGIVVLVARDEVTAADSTVTGVAQVTLEAGETVVLEPGFTASPTDTGQLIARIAH